jgi:hypothetical protein
VTAASYREIVVQDDPIAYFRLGDASGGVAKNEIGDGPTGSYLGNIAYGKPSALKNDPNAAVGFDGANAGIEIVPVSDFLDQQPFTLEAWIKPAVFDNGYHNVLAKWVELTDGGYGYALFHRDAVLSFYRVVSGSEGDYLDFDGLEVGVYTHVVAVYDGVKMRLYVNGAEKMQAVGDSKLAATPVSFMIGANNGAPAYSPFNGLIDEVAVYDHALSVERVLSHYQSGAGIR